MERASRRYRCQIRAIRPDRVCPISPEADPRIRDDRSPPAPTQGRKTHRSRHPPDLTVFPFDQLELQPRRRDRLPEPNRRIAGRKLRFDFQQPHLAGQGAVPWISTPPRVSFAPPRGRDSLHLREIGPRMRRFRIEQAVVESRFVAEQQQALGIHVQPPDRIDAGRKAEIRQRPLTGLIRRELAENPVRLVKRDDHAACLRKKRQLALSSAHRKHRRSAVQPEKPGIQIRGVTHPCQIGNKQPRRERVRFPSQRDRRQHPQPHRKNHAQRRRDLMHPEKHGRPRQIQHHLNPEGPPPAKPADESTAPQRLPSANTRSTIPVRTPNPAACPRVWRVPIPRIIATGRR